MIEDHADILQCSYTNTGSTSAWFRLVFFSPRGGREWKEDEEEWTGGDANIEGYETSHNAVCEWAAGTPYTLDAHLTGVSIMSNDPLDADIMQ